MGNGLLIIGLLIVLDIALWVTGAVLGLSSTNRFRIHACAFLVLCLLLGVFFGWKLAAVLSFVGLWIAALAIPGVGGKLANTGDAS